MDIFILFSYVAAALYGVVDLQLKTSGTGTDAYPQPQNNPEALDNGSLLFWYPSPSAPSKRRNPRSAGTSVPYNEATVQKENELCRPSRDSMLQGVHLPHCSIVKKQSTSYPEQYLKFKFAKLSYPGYYRLIIDSKSLETIKFLSISAVSASHHFIGSLAIGGTHKTKSLEYYTPTSPDCAHPPDANPDLVQNINLPQPKLSEFFHKKSKIEDGEANPKINDFHISILFSDIDKTILGISDNSFIPERNRFIFVVNVQDFNVNVSKKTVAGDCYFNFRSKVYTLRHDAKPLPPEKENEDLTSGSEYVISGESTFDASGNPKISVLTPPPFTTPKPTTTSTARKSTKPYSRTTPTVTTTFPYKTISPLITDSNGLVPDYTTPAGYVPRVPTKKSKPEKELTSNSIYHGCGKKKGCIGDPPDCVKTKSCSSVVTYGEDDDFVKFELMGRAGKYVAIGLSWDRFMGNDSVMECVREYRTQVNAYVSWNFPNRRNLREEDQKSISRVRGKYDNGNIMCEFWKARVFKSKYYEKKIDLGKETFFVLQARGNTAIEGKYGNIGYHSEGTSVTKITYNLHERFRKTKLRLAAEKLHGLLMLFAWLYCFPLSAFLSRYYKETFKDRNCGGYTVWYAWHVIVAWVGLGANFLAMICTAIGMELWERGLSVFHKYIWHFHNKYGMALLSFCFISLMAGYAIKRLNRTRRCQVMNYTHGVVGLVSLWLAITIIYRTTRLDGGLPCGASGLVVTWMVFYIILHIFMSYMVCYVDFVQGERVSRAYNIFLLRTAPHPPYEDVTGSPIRKCFLCIYVSIFSLITFIIILMHAIWDSCVDETVD